MLSEMLLLRKALVFGAAFVYWAGVLVQAWRVRTRIGRSPNVRPRGTKERLLWLGWIAVILGWFGQPFLTKNPGSWFFSPIPGLLHPFGIVLGSVMVGHDGHRGNLYYVAVDPRRQRCGIGTLLVRAAERWLRDAGIRKIHLLVLDGNLAVASFYEKLGYGRAPATLLRKWLAGPKRS